MFFEWFMSDIAKAASACPETSDVLSSFRSRGVRFPYGAFGYANSILDFLVIVAASVLGGNVYQTLSDGAVNKFDLSIGAGATAALLYVGMAHAAGFYRFTAIASSTNMYRRIVQRWIFVSLLMTLLVFLLKVGEIFSRGSTLSFFLITPVLLATSRWLIARTLNGAISDGLVRGRQAVIVGSPEEIATFHFDSLLKDFGLTEVDRIILPRSRPYNLSLGCEERLVLERAIESARAKAADEIVLAMAWSDARRLELVRDWMRKSPLPVQLIPDRSIRTLTENKLFSLKPCLSLEIQRGPLSRLEQMAKRVFDVLVGSLALLLLLPPMIVCALVIKLDSRGPILFRQRRNGFNARQFVIFKFRTMTVAEDGQEVTQAKRFDQRITRAGGILRQSSLDELPQLFNVLKGDMSLVGPRPHALAHDTQYGQVLSEYAFRHHMKPGITGWAQVNGCRGETPQVEQMQRRVEYDLWYINNWSLLLDIRILLRTCVEVLRARNAH
jgi:Undecaprenyl-phosphate glucose phosphotransferase